MARARTASENDTRCIVALGTAESPAIQWAKKSGIRLLDPGDLRAVHDALSKADIVQLAAWNTPETYAWLASPLPSMRLVMTLHITVEYPAQVATPRC